MANRELDSGVYATPLNREILERARPLDKYEQQRWDQIVASMGEFPLGLPTDGHLADQFQPVAKSGPDYMYNPVAEAEAIARQAIIDSSFGPLTEENDSTPVNPAYIHALTAADTRQLIGMEPANV